MAEPTRLVAASHCCSPCTGHGPPPSPQRKGIEKRKRSKLEWDEADGAWKRRYGYKRANDEGSAPVIEAKPGDQVGGRLLLRCRCGGAAAATPLGWLLC